jgi:hypothetical protein
MEASKLINPKVDWESDEYQNWVAEGCSLSTLRNFLQGNAIQSNIFQVFCEVININWHDVVDSTSSSLPELRKRAEKNNFIKNFWVGRESLIEELSDKLQNDFYVLVLTGITGIGKTALAYQIVKKLKLEPYQCENLNFEDDDAQNFISVAANLLQRWGAKLTSSDFKEPEQLLESLLLKLQNHQYLVQMDSIENLLKGNEETGWNNFRDKLWLNFFERFLSLSNCQSRLILTSQDLPNEFQKLSGFVERADVKCLFGLKQLEFLELFEETGLDLTEDINVDYLKRIGDAYQGHPLALLVIAGEIQGEPFDGNLEKYWDEHGKEIEEIKKARQNTDIDSEYNQIKLGRSTINLRQCVKKKIDKTFARLKDDHSDAYKLLLAGAVYRRSVPQDAWFSYLKKEGCDENQCLIALKTLGSRYLVVVEEFLHGKILLRQHNLIRSIAIVHAKKLKKIKYE